MKKIMILIPIFNDWDSFKKLIFEIDQIIKDFNNFSFDCIVVNDASTIDQPNLSKPKHFTKLQILNMKENKGHARCNAFGIRYINENTRFDHLILMDGDGEDRPEEIRNLIDKLKKDQNTSVVAKRIKRSEGPFFRFLYIMHKFITYIFTGKKINFGNYSCLTNNDVKKISLKASLWSSYSGTVKKYIKNFSSINSIRGSRYFGPSKMSLYNLIIHSFSIIAVFKKQVFLRSILFFLTLFPLKMYLGSISILLQILLIIFCIIIYFISLRERKDELLNSHKNLKDFKEITH